MRFTGNVARTFGQVLLALGIIALVFSVLAFLGSAYVVDKATDDPQVRDGAGDVLQGLVGTGLGLLAGGTVAVVAGILLLGVARALRDRSDRGRPAPVPAPTPATTGP